MARAKSPREMLSDDEGDTDIADTDVRVFIRKGGRFIHQNVTYDSLRLLALNCLCCAAWLVGRPAIDSESVWTGSGAKVLTVSLDGCEH